MYTTYDIFDDVLNLRNLVDRFFSDTPSISRRYDYPYVNLYENGDNLEIRVLTPGVRVEDININLIDNSLVIEGDKKADYKDIPYIRRERDFGRFSKSIKLPFKVDVNNINATMKDGILIVKLVKSEEAKPKKIEIK